MTDNRNTILAVILSGMVLIGWQYFFVVPQMEKQQAAQKAQQPSPAEAGAAGARRPRQARRPQPGARAVRQGTPGPAAARRAAGVSATPRSPPRRA